MRTIVVVVLCVLAAPASAEPQRFEVGQRDGVANLLVIDIPAGWTHALRDRDLFIESPGGEVKLQVHWSLNTTGLTPAELNQRAREQLVVRDCSDARDVLAPSAPAGMVFEGCVLQIGPREMPAYLGAWVFAHHRYELVIQFWEVAGADTPLGKQTDALFGSLRMERSSPPAPPASAP